MATTHNSMTDLLAALRSATDAKKCHRCGCFHGSVDQLEKSIPGLPREAATQLLPILRDGRARLVPSEYDCLGCAICWPADALNLAWEQFPDAGIAADESCTRAARDRIQAWPPLPGNFQVLDAGGDIAVCVLTSERLISAIANRRPHRVALVGAVYTENLGLERILSNVLANPSVTTLFLCGADSRQRVGHLPGQSLLSLMANGLDESGRIIGAQGRRPIIKNLSRGLVEEFRRSVTVVDRIGEEHLDGILECLVHLPAMTRRREAGLATTGTPRIRARATGRLVLDPAGYFVVLPDRTRGMIVLEHYRNDGLRAHVLEGACGEHLISTVIEHGLVSRLDHTAYLGKELALAERALATGEPYVQDRAPEPESASACGSGCGCPSASQRKEEHP